MSGDNKMDPNNNDEPVHVNHEGDVVDSYGNDDNQYHSEVNNDGKNVDNNNDDDDGDHNDDDHNNDDDEKSLDEPSPGKRRLSKRDRTRHAKLRFVPGVNYVPGMHYHSHLFNLDEHPEKLTNQPLSNIEQIAKEYDESKKNSDRYEHLLYELKLTIEEIENLPRNVKLQQGRNPRSGSRQ